MADWYRGERRRRMPAKPESNGKKVAVVGSGPAGLTCASDLAKMGYDGHHFRGPAHRRRRAGLRHPRVPSAQGHRGQARSTKLKALGVEVMTDMVIGRVLVHRRAVRDGLSRPCSSAPAQDCPCSCTSPARRCRACISANEYLTRTNLMKAYTEEADTPIITDARLWPWSAAATWLWTAPAVPCVWARSKVYIVYRRGEAEMPARLEEQHHAKEEGIEFKTLCNPVRNSRRRGRPCVRREVRAYGAGRA